MGKTFRKIIALFITLCMLLAIAPAAMADGYAVTINGATTESGAVTGVDVTVNEDGSYTLYAAVYDGSTLSNVASKSFTESGTVSFDETLGVNSKTQTLRLYVWDDEHRPAAEAYEDEAEGYTATFITDDHVTITVSDTKSFDGEVAEDAETAIARDGDSGAILTDGDGQVNFIINVAEGYQVASVTATEGTYKNIKGPADTGITNGYRITKITDDLTITVTTEEIPEETGDGIIHLNGDSIDAAGVDNVTVDGTTVTITAAGEYEIEGTLTDGQIAVASTVGKKDAVKITLDGVSVTSSTGSAFDAENGKITLITDTANTFVTTAADAAAVYSKKDLTIQGGGSITANSDSGNGIHCKKDLTIEDVDVTVTAGNNGIKGNQSVTVADSAGDITVTAVKDGITSDQAPEIDSATGAFDADSIVDDGGAVTINGGTINITTTGTTKTGDGIQADTLLTITGGDITINATGEAIKSNFSQYDVTDATDYAANEATVAAYNGCIVISGGEITATAGEDGIKAINSFEMRGGNVTVEAQLDGIQAGKAYTALDLGTGTDDETVIYETNGVVNITGGNLTITAAGGATRTIKDNDGNTTLDDIDYSCKGIKARKLIDISGGTLNVNALDDAIHSNHTANISGGTITVQSCDDGVHGEYYLYISGDAYIDVQKSYEGIEGSKIYISGGETYVVSTDDGANAAGDEPTDSAYTLSTVYSSDVTTASVVLMAGGFNGGGNSGWGGGPGMNDNSASYGYMEVSGGLLYIEAEGDGFDSNGSGVISGGTVLVNGPTSGGNGVFDIGDSSGDTLTITGGTVIGAGTSDMAVTPTSATGSQAYVVTTVSTQSAGKAIQVMSDSDEIVTYIPSKNYAWIFVSTPSISSGTSYTVKYGGSVSGGTWAENYKETYGIKTDATFSGGSGSSVTAVTGGSSSGGSQGGPGQGGPGGGR